MVSRNFKSAIKDGRKLLPPDEDEMIANGHPQELQGEEESLQDQQNQLNRFMNHEEGDELETLESLTSDLDEGDSVNKEDIQNLDNLDDEEFMKRKIRESRSNRIEEPVVENDSLQDEEENIHAMKLDNDIVDNSEELESLKSEVKVKDGKIDSLKEELESVKSDIESSHSELNQVKDELKESNEVKESYLIKINELEQEVENGKNALIEENKSNEKTVNALQAKLDEANAKIQELKDINEEVANKEDSEVMLEMNSLISSNKEKDVDISNLEKRNKELEGLVKQGQKFVKDSKAELDRVNLSKEKISKELILKDTELEKVQQELEGKDLEIKELNATAIRLQELVEQTKSGSLSEIGGFVLNYTVVNTVNYMISNYKGSMFTKQYLDDLLTQFKNGEMSSSNPLLNALFDEAIKNKVKTDYLGKYSENVLQYIKNGDVTIDPVDVKEPVQAVKPAKKVTAETGNTEPKRRPGRPKVDK